MQFLWRRFDAGCWDNAVDEWKIGIEILCCVDGGQTLSSAHVTGLDFLTILGEHEGEGLVVDADAAVAGSRSAHIADKGQKARHLPVTGIPILYGYPQETFQVQPLTTVVISFRSAPNICTLDVCAAVCDSTKLHHSALASMPAQGHAAALQVDAKIVEVALFFQRELESVRAPDASPADAAPLEGRP